jgi:hypothetical protein
MGGGLEPVTGVYYTTNQVLELFWNWLILPSADFVAVLLIVPFGAAPLVAAYLTWVYGVKILEGGNDGRARHPTTFIIAGILFLYVLLVTAAALHRAPYVGDKMPQQESYPEY